ncbi:MAG: AtpZ/AtpI family protein [bacterium]|nr:AtpZ/AtpI family protein [bacterium]
MFKGYQPPKQDPLAIGLTIVAVTALFGLVGWWIDNRLKTFPLLMVLGAIIGFVAALYRTILMLRQQDSRNDSDSAE